MASALPIARPFTPADDCRGIDLFRPGAGFVRARAGQGSNRPVTAARLTRTRDPWSLTMTFPQTPRHVEIRSGGQIVAAAEVSMPAAGTARTSLHAAAGHVAPGWRTDLVDAVLDLPEVRASERLEATVPIGDGEFLDRLRERTTGAVTRPAGSTVLLDAIIPPQRRPET
jgi:hypothetical protein